MEILFKRDTHTLSKPFLNTLQLQEILPKYIFQNAIGLLKNNTTVDFLMICISVLQFSIELRSEINEE